MGNRRKRQHPDNPELFWCPRCETYKARGEFTSNNKNTLGVGGECKDCHRDRYVKKGPRIIIYGKTKICPQCKETKMRKMFSRNKCNPDGLSGWCKQCCEIKRLVWKEKNRPQYLESQKKYYEKNKDRLKISSKERRIKIYNDPILLAHHRELDKKARMAPHRKEHASAYSKKFAPEYNRKNRKLLLDPYVKQLLRVNNNIYDPSSETIELKRQQLIMLRTLKKFKEWRKEHESNYEDVHGKQRENGQDNEREFSTGQDSGGAERV
jgi:hypothetical protein